MLAELVERAALPPAQSARVEQQAGALVAAIRRRQQDASGVDALLREYDLSSGEGIVLMCLAEALLRIPDADTADRLIADKLGSADWQAHLGKSESLFVNASTWALLLTGRIVRPAEVDEAPASFFARLVERVGEPVVRAALRQAMRILGQQFVMGETIESALRRAARVARVQLFVRHARRGGADGRGCASAISPPTPRRSRPSGAAPRAPARCSTRRASP